MNLQVAIDRYTFEELADYLAIFDGKADIIEIGTSFVKDYGLEKLSCLRKLIKKSQLLIDIKTNDEGAYEFQKGFEAGADILTVMASSSLATLKACYEIAKKYRKTMFIDLLEVSDEKIQQLQEFEEAIFCIHYSVDSTQVVDAVEALAAYRQKFPWMKHLAIAGGMDLIQAKKLSEKQLVDIIVVGSKITKDAEPEKMLLKFAEVIKND